MAGLSELERDALNALATGVRARFGGRVRRIVLFGSRARGEGRSDSDLDVLVLVDGLARDERREVQDLAFDVGFERGLVFSPIAAAAETWVGDSLLAAEIEQDGVPL